MPSIFISYRRADSQGEAGRLFDDLSLRFKPGSVFMDVTTIAPGRDFRDAIQRSISTCSVLLAVIGQQWVDLRNTVGARRLDEPNDIVRTEIAYALRRDIPVVPVLVRGARMPDSEHLPEELRELSYRNAVELTHARWKSDVQVLIQGIAQYLQGCEGNTTDLESEKNSTELRGASSTEPVAKDLSGADFASRIEAGTIERVSRELATYIGPISEVVVRRAAKRCTRVEDIYGMAAQEIETEADRVRFLRGCSK